MAIPRQSDHVFVHHLRHAFDACHQAEMRKHSKVARALADVVTVFMVLLPFLARSPRPCGSGEATPPFFKVSTPAGDIP